jgi:hypothetical protein
MTTAGVSSHVSAKYKKSFVFCVEEHGHNHGLTHASRGNATWRNLSLVIQHVVWFGAKKARYGREQIRNHILEPFRS